MGKRLLMVFEKIWVRVLHKGGRTPADSGFVVTIHQTLNKINKSQRLLFSLPHFFAVTDGIL